MNIVGLDIGGANIKAADAENTALSVPFAMWRDFEQLPDTLSAVVARFAPPDIVAVTMTGELADCFATKSEGVDAILGSVERASGGARIVVWQTGSEFVAPPVARDIPLLVAAANWHALATWIGRMVPDDAGILVDAGSTTIDIIPLESGIPVPSGMTDRERLESGELVYSGARRTPLCAIAHSVPLNGGYCPVAAELFATTLDVYLLLGDIPEDESDLNTVNGRPATIAAAYDRVARALCCDRTEVSLDDARSIARFVADVQRQRINGALERVVSRLRSEHDGVSPASQPFAPHVLISGSGAFMAERVVRSNRTLRESPTTRLSEMIDRHTADAACAFAVAQLARERVV